MTKTILNRFSWIDFSDELFGDKLFKLGDMRDAYRWSASEEEELFDSIHDTDVNLHSSLYCSERLVFHENNRKLAEKWHHFCYRNHYQCLLFDHCPVSLSIT